MASPQNPLDKYVTYTYHFELHLVHTFEEALNVARETVPRPNPTTPTDCNGSLVISTIKDAHHTIDNVKYSYDTPFVSTAGITAAASDVTMTVTEPGGCSFFEKIKKRYDEMNITSVGLGVWLLKIFFVGRLEDNTIETTLPVSIPLVCQEMGAKFDHRGGEYDMLFYPVFESLTTNVPNNPLAQAIGYSNKDIHVSALTIQEALQQLQQKLNDNYNYYVDSLETQARRRVRYVIESDPRIDGELHVNNSDSFAPGEPKKLTFPMKEPIIYALQKIVTSSTEMNNMIAESKQSLNREFYPGSLYPTYDVFYEPREDEILVTYKISLCEGRNGPEAGIDYEFDYLFALPGKNVDVINFEIKYENMFAWMENLINVATPTQTASDPRVPSQEPGVFSKNTHVENRTQARDSRDAPDTATVDTKLKAMDAVTVPGSPRTSDQGFLRYESAAVEPAKLAFDSIAEVHSAHNMQQAFTIRGHYDLLDLVSNFGLDTPRVGKEYSIWCKVNIKDKSGRDFFYTGWYIIQGIENVFQNGQFTQNISTQMVEPPNTYTSDGAGSGVTQSGYFDGGALW